jgi:hypothetical protein
LHPLAHQFERLQEFVEEQHAAHSRLSIGENIDWRPIAKELHRSTAACQHKMSISQRSLRAQSLKKGAFTLQEDAIIRLWVEKWDKSKQGLWTGLGRELNRPPPPIQKRWRFVLSECSEC